MDQINGIGPVLAQKLMTEVVAPAVAGTSYERPGHTYTEKELRRICRLPSIWQHLPAAARADLRYNPLRRIPRDIIHIIDGELRKYVLQARFDIAGSYLRGKTSSSDIDIVLQVDPKDTLGLSRLYEVNKHSRSVRLLQPFAEGVDKAALLVEVCVPLYLQKLPLLIDNMTTTKKVYIKADVFLASAKEYMYTLLFATGSGKFNIRMRATAKRKGYLLNQRGLFRVTNQAPIKVRDERDLFHILGMTYKLPPEREL